MIVCLRTVVVLPECRERYQVTGGYLNLRGLTACDPSPTQRDTQEPS
jgi:hypothetical protein